MLNVHNYQGNANQNHNEISSHACQKAYYQKRQQMRSVGKDVEKREHSWSVGESVNWCSHCGK